MDNPIRASNVIILPSHISTTGHNLIVINETATAEVSGVAWQFPGHTDITFTGFQRINAANVVQTTTRYKVARWGISARHYPRTT